MEVTFLSNVHFEAKLVSSPTAQGKKRESFFSSPSHSPTFFWVTFFLFHDPRVLFQQQSITYSTSSSLARLQSEHAAVFPSPRIAPHLRLLHLLTHSSCQTPYSSCLLTRGLLFLISEFLPDWQISIILEDLHKSLPSHFLAEMAFLTICTVSDHTEHSMNAALIPIFSADRVKEEWGSLVTF